MKQRYALFHYSYIFFHYDNFRVFCLLLLFTSYINHFLPIIIFISLIPMIVFIPFVLYYIFIFPIFYLNFQVNFLSLLFLMTPYLILIKNYCDLPLFPSFFSLNFLFNEYPIILTTLLNPSN